MLPKGVNADELGFSPCFEDGSETDGLYMLEVVSPTDLAGNCVIVDAEQEAVYGLLPCENEIAGAALEYMRDRGFE